MGNIKLFVTGFENFIEATKNYSNYRGPFNLNGINGETICYELSKRNVPSIECLLNIGDFMPAVARNHADYMAGIDTVWFTNFIDHLIDENEYEPCGTYLLNLKQHRPDLNIVISSGLGRKTSGNNFYRRVKELEKTINSLSRVSSFKQLHKETPELQVIHSFYDFGKYIDQRILEDKKTQARQFNPNFRFY